MEDPGSQLDGYYLRRAEPMQGCLFALKDIIMRSANGVTHERKFQIPFFYYKGKKLAYLWVVGKKKLQLGFATDRSLLTFAEGEKRKDRYVSLLIDPVADLPIEEIRDQLAIHLEKIERGSL